MEKSPGYELTERRDDNMQLISGSVAMPSENLSRIDRKEVQRSNFKLYCCIVSFAVIAVLALCAAVAAIILVAAFPNVANPGVQEVLVLKDQLAAQLASTSSPSTCSGTNNQSEEIKMIRETIQDSLSSLSTSLQASMNSIDTSLQASMNTIANSIEVSSNSTKTLEATVSSVGSSIEASLNLMGTLLERLVEGKSFIFFIKNFCSIDTL